MTNIPYFDESIDDDPGGWRERAAAKRRKDEDEYYERANRAAELAAEVARLTAERDALRAKIEALPIWEADNGRTSLVSLSAVLALIAP